jgi:hypothetical protein
VQLSSGIEVFAMCAIDALGIAFMLNQPTVVRSADPRSAEPVQVTVSPGGPSDSSPAGAGVIVACSGAGDSARCTCPHTNFTSSVEAGQAWPDQTPGLAGEVISMRDAIATGRDTFAALLDG